VRWRGPGASGEVTIVTVVVVGRAEDCGGDEGRQCVIGFGEGKDPRREVDNMIGAGRYSSACLKYRLSSRARQNLSPQPPCSQH
jgi:hypothetical protein